MSKKYQSAILEILKPVVTVPEIFEHGSVILFSDKLTLIFFGFFQDMPEEVNKISN